MTKQNKTEKNKYIKDLKKLVKLDSNLYVNINSVSSSGMTRKLSVYAIVKSDKSILKNGTWSKKKVNTLIKLNWYISKLDIIRLDKNGACIVRGCGMDMAFWLTNYIKSKLYGHKKALSNQQYTII
jgi:hypothetical protein